MKPVGGSLGNRNSKLGRKQPAVYSQSVFLLSLLKVWVWLSGSLGSFWPCFLLCCWIWSRILSQSAEVPYVLQIHEKRTNHLVTCSTGSPTLIPQSTNSVADSAKVKVCVLSSLQLLRSTNGGKFELTTVNTGAINVCVSGWNITADFRNWITPACIQTGWSGTGLCDLHMLQLWCWSLTWESISM